MSSLLGKDQVILSFGYDGQFVKINKRELNIMMEKKAATKLIDSVITPGKNMFWKSKKSNKVQNITNKTINSSLN